MEAINETSGSTPNFRTELAEKLAQLVPEAIADGKVDIAKLRELLQEDAGDETERFGLFWPGKRRAMRSAQEPTTATLRPDKESSKDWDTTHNVFIEGDNLEVLKILQKHYHNKVKMIFIDPPYNTGKDFVYPDNFKEGLETYLEWTRQVNEDGKKVSTNSESEGRYHSNWLNMIYPRLKLARNLLSDDGVIFITIDDVEQPHLSKVCDEIFGESNFVANIIWRSRTSISDDHEISRNHNHILVYARQKSQLKFFGDPLDETEYSNPDGDMRGPWKAVPLDANKPGGDTLYPVINPNTGAEHFPPVGRSWSINSKEMQKLIEAGRIYFGKEGTTGPKRKLFYNERIARGDTKTPSSVLLDAGTTKDGTTEVANLFGSKGVFDYPKPSLLLKRLIQWGTGAGSDALILDFFAGSATIGESIFKANLEDGGSRKFILVQLPEPVDTQSAAAKLGFKNLSQIARERISLAAKSEVSNLNNQEVSVDLGLRSFVLADSNFGKWRVSSDTDRNALEQHLFSLRESASDNATPDDLLTEILLKQGYSLTERIAEFQIAGLDVRIVGENMVIAYLTESVKPSLEQLRAVVDQDPQRIIVLEDAFHGDDELKTNLAQLCKSKGIELWTA